nr:T32N4.1 gene product [Arabidopsis thaliana]
MESAELNGRSNRAIIFLFHQYQWICSKPFIVCQVDSEITYPIISSLSLGSVVVEAIKCGEWWLSNSRSRNPIIQILRQCLPNPHAINPLAKRTFITAMYILDTGARFSAVRFSPVFNPPPTSLRRRYFIVRANLPFPKHQAKYHKELEVAIDAVDRACRLCVDVS